MSSSGSKDTKRKKSSGSVASSEDDQEAEKDRMETKRHREKKRRFEITHAVERLSKMIMKIDPDILQTKSGNVQGMSSGIGAHYGNNGASASFHRSLNRTDVITCACEVMGRLHEENERLRQELKDLGKDKEAGQGLFQGSPVAMMNVTGHPNAASNMSATARSVATNSGLMNHIPNAVISGAITNTIASNTESKMRNGSLLANSLGTSHPSAADSRQDTKQHPRSSASSNSMQATSDATSPQMLQNQYNLLQQLMQLQQMQQQYPLAMQQLANSTGIGGVSGLFPMNTVFGGASNNFSALTPGPLPGINSLPLGSPMSNSYDMQALQQLLLSRSLQQQQQQGSNRDQGVSNEITSSASGGTMMMHNFGNAGHEHKGIG